MPQLKINPFLFYNCVSSRGGGIRVLHLEAFTEHAKHRARLHIHGTDGQTIGVNILFQKLQDTSPLFADNRGAIITFSLIGATNMTSNCGVCPKNGTNNILNNCKGPAPFHQTEIPRENKLAKSRNPTNWQKKWAKLGH